MAIIINAVSPAASSLSAAEIRYSLRHSGLWKNFISAMKEMGVRGEEALAARLISA